jgi:ubiquinol-cytochrome c reductase cytochrome b subunit
VRGIERLRELAAVASLTFLALLVLSGWALMASYVPSEREAFDSVLHIRQQGAIGPFVRNVHFWLASGLVTSGALYLGLAIVSGAPARQPLAWWASLVGFLLVLGLCFTGYLLPMDQNALWGTTVRLGIIETIPLLGGLKADLLRGGPTLNAATLTRFYALHTAVLPAALLAALGALAVAARDWLSAAANARRSLLTAAAVLALSYLLCALLPAPLEPRGSAADAEYVPRPEWYFLWLFQVGKYVEALPWIRSLLLPVAGLSALLAMPLWTAPSPTARLTLVALAALAWGGLTGLALWEDRGLPLKPTHEQALALRAEGIYREECQSCHGASGKGDGSQARSFGLEVPDMTRAAFWSRTSEDRMRGIIRTGKGKDMPAFGRKLQPEEIDAMVALMVERYRALAQRNEGTR